VCGYQAQLDLGVDDVIRKLSSYLDSGFLGNCFIVGMFLKHMLDVSPGNARPSRHHLNPRGGDTSCSNSTQAFWLVWILHTQVICSSLTKFLWHRDYSPPGNQA
jgi:hypothetical protein